MLLQNKLQKKDAWADFKFLHYHHFAALMSCECVCVFDKLGIETLKSTFLENSTFNLLDIPTPLDVIVTSDW